MSSLIGNIALHSSVEFKEELGITLFGIAVPAVVYNAMCCTTWHHIVLHCIGVGGVIGGPIPNDKGEGSWPVTVGTSNWGPPSPVYHSDYLLNI